MSKKCVKCEITKLETDFYNNKLSSDGLQSYCKQCQTDHRRASQRRQKRAQGRQAIQPALALTRRVAPKMPEGMLVFMIPISDGKDIQAWCDQAMRDYLLSQLRRGEGA